MSPACQYFDRKLLPVHGAEDTEAGEIESCARENVNLERGKKRVRDSHRGTGFAGVQARDRSAEFR